MIMSFSKGTTAWATKERSQIVEEHDLAAEQSGSW